MFLYYFDRNQPKYKLETKQFGVLLKKAIEFFRSFGDLSMFRPRYHILVFQNNVLEPQQFSRHVSNERKERREREGGEKKKECDRDGERISKRKLRKQRTSKGVTEIEKACCRGYFLRIENYSPENRSSPN